MSEELKRLYLKTEELYTLGAFRNTVPAFNNTYDVNIKFVGDLLEYVNAHGLYSARDKLNPGQYLALFCSEAVLPGSQITTQTVDGLRQGVSQHFATFRKYPDIDLTFYTQKDYYTNDVFNAWLEYISPSLESTQFGAVFDTNRTTSSYKKLRYPNSYKCDILITAFATDHIIKGKELLSPISNSEEEREDKIQIPTNIQYRLIRAFPTNIVSAPLAYGDAQLIKTTITFKYDQFFINRQSRANFIDGELRLKDIQTIAALNTK
jgi:hypothetical protein